MNKPIVLFLFSKVIPFGSRMLRETVKAGFFVIFLVSVGVGRIGEGGNGFWMNFNLYIIIIRTGCIV